MYNQRKEVYIYILGTVIQWALIQLILFLKNIWGSVWRYYNEGKIVGRDCTFTLLVNFPYCLKGLEIKLFGTSLQINILVLNSVF